MAKDKIPQVVILPEAQAQIDADPVLKKALAGLNETLLNAMQGTQDGRYKSFDDAIEAMTGERPEQIAPPNPPKHGYFLSTDISPKNPRELMAVISDGHPQHGHTQIEICDVEFFPIGPKAEKQARAWYRRRCRELPWDSGAPSIVTPSE